MNQQGSKQIQELQQRQTLSAQQVLTVRLLELPITELENKVRAEIQDNPALEEGKLQEEEEPELLSQEGDDTSITAQELELGDYRTVDDIPDYKLRSRNYSPQEQMENIPFSEDATLYEQLIQQLGELQLSEKEYQLAIYLIGSLDSDGFLRKELSTIAEDLAIYQGIEPTEKQLETLLQHIQEFEPAGIGARNLQECLLLQLCRKKPTKKREQLMLIIKKYYKDFSNKHWTRLSERLRISEDELEGLVKELIHLNPRPGSAMGESITRNYQQIIPDFIVETVEDNIYLSLNNQQTPELRINNDYLNMLEDRTKNKKQSLDEKNAALFLKQKIEAAKGFITAIKERQSTLLRTMQAIIDKQRPFFLEGDESLLKPMILKDIASITELDISTISRVNNSKYVQTNYGIYPLKFFFNDGYITEGGDELSTREIRNQLKKIVDLEDKKHPYTDEDLAVILKEKGYPVARRTVAKYRQQLGLPVARLRK